MAGKKSLMSSFLSSSRQLDVTWEVTVSRFSGQDLVLEQSQVNFLRSSVIISWNLVASVKLRHIRNIQLHARSCDRSDEPPHPPHPPQPPRFSSSPSSSSSRPGWRSLIFSLDVDDRLVRPLGSDQLVTLLQLSPSCIVGIWRVKT